MDHNDEYLCLEISNTLKLFASLYVQVKAAQYLPLQEKAHVKKNMTSTNLEILDKSMSLLFFSQVILSCKDVCLHSLPFASTIFFPTYNYPLRYTPQ